MSIWIWLGIAFVVLVGIVVSIRIANSENSSSEDGFWNKVKATCCLRRI